MPVFLTHSSPHPYFFTLCIKDDLLLISQEKPNIDLLFKTFYLDLGE